MYSAEIGIGSINTNNILNDCPDSSAASEVRVLGHDWFLPSLKEIKKMYENKDILEEVPRFSALLNFYWSSTEMNSEVAWGFDFEYGNERFYNKDETKKVRAVKKF